MSISLGILLLFGIGVFGGLLSALLIKRLSIPQVLGYILVGIIIGVSGLNLVSASDIEKLSPFNNFALGIIGFLVGAELRFGTLKKYGKQFTTILFAEGILAFILVCIPVSLIIHHVTHSLSVSIAAGIVFGAIASATDPASTINVLWEYRTAGILTTTIIAIVALDDALAMTLYGFGTSIARIISGNNPKVLIELFHTSMALFGSIVLGLIAGIFLNLVLRKSRDQDYISSIAIGILLLCIGIAVSLKLDVILVTMSIGITIINLSPHRSRELIQTLKRFSIPIYIMFFVLVGTRLGIKHMPGWLWLIIVLYVIGRSLGKLIGAWFGARLTGSDEVVRKYAGLGLFAQGGVAIGLSIMASEHLNNVSVTETLYLGDVIIFGITATTLIVQVIGPTMVKYAVKRAGEIGLNITDADIIEKWKVSDVMMTDVPVIKENEPVRSMLHKFQDSGFPFLPVVTSDKSIIGIITFEEVKNVILDDTTWDWLLATDIMSPLHDIITENERLDEAIAIMNQLFSEYLPVVDTDENRIFRGILDKRLIKKAINKKMIAGVNKKS